MRVVSTVFIIAALAFGITAADKKPEKPVEPIKVVKLDRNDAVTYEKDIAPVLENKCAYCHSGPVKEAKFDMGTYEALMKGGKRGVPIVPGKPDQSLLVKLAGRSEKPTMPPKNEEPLTPQELALIKLWIEQGAKAPTGVKIAKREAKLTKLPETVKPVVALAVSADKSAVVAGRGSQIHVYDAGSGSYIRPLVNPELKDDKGAPLGIAHLDIVQSLTFSPDGRWIASGGFREVILWDAQTGMLRRKWTEFADRVVALDFTKDGKLLATGGGAPTEDGEIKVFDVTTGNLVLDIKNGHSDTVFGVRFSPDGTKLATCAADKFVKVFELPSGKFLKAFEGHTHHVMDVGWRADGKVLASCGADNVIKVWDYDRGEQTRTINAHGKQITRMVFIGTSPNVATCSGDASVKFFNVENGGNVRNFSGSSDFLYAVGASPDGSVVAAGGEESVVRLYNGTNGQLLKTLAPPGSDPEKAKK
jgi:WD40 repeat protein